MNKKESTAAQRRKGAKSGKTSYNKQWGVTEYDSMPLSKLRIDDQSALNDVRY